jgi:hypothetical protein
VLEGQINIKEFNHNVAKYKLVSQPSDLIRQNYVKEITQRLGHNICNFCFIKKKEQSQLKNITSLHLYPYPKTAANKFLRDHNSTVKFKYNRAIPHVQCNTHPNTTIQSLKY